MSSEARILRWLISAVALAVVACGGGSLKPAPSSSSSAQAAICNCTPHELAFSDYRHDAKHVGLPDSSGESISVADILAWPQGASPPADVPRSGRELLEFTISHAWLQLAWENPGDCDIHFEISDVPSQIAARMIVEIPIDNEYCPARQNIQQQLAAQNLTLNTSAARSWSPRCGRYTRDGDGFIAVADRIPIAELRP